MSDAVQKLKKVWNSYQDKMAKRGIDVSDARLDSLLASIFSPGPFYYYIMDFSAYELTFIHPNVRDIMGLEPEKLKLQDFSSKIHPEDINYYIQCEKMATKFLFSFIQKEQIPNYKVSYAFRMQDKDGQYRLFLQQSIVLSMDDEDRIGRVLGVHSDISHIMSENNYKISFIGLRGEKSYLGLEVLKGETEFQILNSNLTEREVQIIRLLSEGFTAQEIAEALFLSFHTVRTHRKNILEKLECRNTAQLVAKSIRNGII